MDANEKNLPVYSVAEISTALKRVVEDGFGWVRIRGEISGFKRAASGHLYFSLKDENTNIDAVCWRGTAGRLSLKPEDGMEVIVTGGLTIYPGRSRYQVVVQALEAAGEGALLKLLQERKKSLQDEGLFEQSRKQSLPYIPEVIGVVTSPTGAVIRDILERLKSRFPTHVIIWPALVQGDGAAEEISNAIYGFNDLKPEDNIAKPDLIIVARGGGSLEDLWAFNEEIVVRAVDSSEIPIISAVGHETDTTLIDLVADLRAPTPTAAAEMAVPVRNQLLEALADREKRIFASMHRLISSKNTYLLALIRGIPDARSIIGLATQNFDDKCESIIREIQRKFVIKQKIISTLRVHHPRQIISFKSERFSEKKLQLSKMNPTTSIQNLIFELEKNYLKLHQLLIGKLKDSNNALEHNHRLLESLSYKGVLARGFTVVRDPKKHTILSVSEVSKGIKFLIEFKDGKVEAYSQQKQSKGSVSVNNHESEEIETKQDELQGKLL